MEGKMKNLLLLSISFLTVLTGCEMEGSKEFINDSQNNSTQTVTENSDIIEEASKKKLENSEAIDSLENYQEFWSQDYFNPEDFQIHLSTDNPGTRIFIFHEDSEQYYKTIFIKDEKRLKIIDLVNDKLLMNEIIN